MPGEKIAQTAEVHEIEHKPGHECSLSGIYLFGEPGTVAVNMTYYSLAAQNGRGHEGAGIVVSDGRHLLGMKELGPVPEAFQRGESLIGLVDAHLAIGSTRYGTHNTIQNGKKIDKKTERDKLMPMNGYSQKQNLPFALASNGQLVNFEELIESEAINREKCITDSALVTEMIKKALDEGPQGMQLVEAVEEVALKLKGGFSFVVMGRDDLIGLRGPNGIRPLVLGRVGENGMANGWMLSSEVGGIEVPGAIFEREIEPGEVVVINSTGINSRSPFAEHQISNMPCLFEYFYLARDDQQMNGINMGLVRNAWGRRLARDHPVEADYIFPVLDTALEASFGFNETSGIPLRGALVRNRYLAGRTFINTSQALRQMGIAKKSNLNKYMVKGKKVVVVDDTIVRANTMGHFVEELFNDGAEEVHVRIASPPITKPCYYGVDIPNENDLVAAYDRPLEEIRQRIGSPTSLAYLSLEAIMEEAGQVQKETASKKIGGLANHASGSGCGFCTACMTGMYMAGLPGNLKQEVRT